MIEKHELFEYGIGLAKKCRTFLEKTRKGEALSFAEALQYGVDRRELDGFVKGLYHLGVFSEEEVRFLFGAATGVLDLDSPVSPASTGANIDNSKCAFRGFIEELPELDSL